MIHSSRERACSRGGVRATRHRARHRSTRFFTRYGLASNRVIRMTPNGPAGQLVALEDDRRDGPPTVSTSFTPNVPSHAFNAAFPKRVLRLRVAPSRAAARVSLGHSRTVLSSPRFCPRDVFAPKNRPNKASSKQRRSRHFPETLSLVETAAGRLDLPSAIFRFCATDVSSRRQVSVGENRHPPARTSPTLLVEHGGSSELRHGVARGRDIERTNAKARRVDQHESHVTVRTLKISARTNRWW